MFNEEMDPYDRIIILEAQVQELWEINQELAEQLKEACQAGVGYSQAVIDLSRGYEQLYNMLHNVEFRTKILEIKTNEKTITRPTR